MWTEILAGNVRCGGDLLWLSSPTSTPTFTGGHDLLRNSPAEMRCWRSAAARCELPVCIGSPLSAPSGARKGPCSADEPALSCPTASWELSFHGAWQARSCPSTLKHSDINSSKEAGTSRMINSSFSSSGKSNALRNASGPQPVTSAKIQKSME